MHVPPPADDFRFGVSLYTSAWPLVEHPLRDFQIGLASIWIVPDNRDTEEPLLPHGTVARDSWPERGPSYRDVFQTIEGGLGFWASTRFGCTTAKFRMNGTANGYNREVSSPGWGFGDPKSLPASEMGIVQLSPSLLVPPDGLTFQDGTCGELFGYAWMVLPLIEARARTAGLDVPTGSQCWTLFLNASNFKGPVAFYTPATWSRVSLHHPPAVGRGLDARPGLVTGGAIEVNTVPRLVGRDPKGVQWTRIPRLQFPADAEGRTVLIHDLTHYSKQALYDDVERWLAGGDPASGRFDRSGASTPRCSANPLALQQGPDKLAIGGLDDWAETKALDDHTFGLQWKKQALEPWSGAWRRGALPEYFEVSDGAIHAKPATAVPVATGLVRAKFAAAGSEQSYVSTEDKTDAWHVPGPRAGPFDARLADGSVVRYAWYRFVDQPALQNSNLMPEEKRRLQSVVERIHARWTRDREYMLPPEHGKLAGLDPALLVEPPPGVGPGCVPIVLRQSPR